MMFEIKNREYQSKMETAILSAIIKAARMDDEPTAVLLTGEIVDACLNVIALHVCSSKVVSSPTKIRTFCDDTAKSLRPRISRAREHFESGEMDWMKISHAEDRH